MSIQTTLDRCLKNDREAQRLLYHQYKDVLMSIAYRYCADIDTAKDALQNAFIKIFTKLSTFDAQKGTFQNWCTRIVINEALIIKRKAKTWVALEDVHTSAYDTSTNQIDKMTVKELSILIDQLPELHRVMLNLYYFEEYTHKEIAEILKIKESSSRSQLSKSRKVLLENWHKFNLSAKL